MAERQPRRILRLLLEECGLSPWVRYLIAFVVFGHGFIYLRIGPTIADTLKEWKGSSWLLGSAITKDRLKTLVLTLNLIAGIVTIACAAAIAFAPTLPGWWRPLAFCSAAVGVLAFAVFWDGQAQLLFEEGAIGVIVSLALLAVLAMTYADLGDTEKALQSLEQAAREGSNFLASLHSEPRYDPLRADPRFVALHCRFRGDVYFDTDPVPADLAGSFIRQALARG